MENQTTFYQSCSLVMFDYSCIYCNTFCALLSRRVPAKKNNCPCISMTKAPHCSLGMFMLVAVCTAWSKLWHTRQSDAHGTGKSPIHQNTTKPIQRCKQRMAGLEAVHVTVQLTDKLLLTLWLFVWRVWMCVRVCVCVCMRAYMHQWTYAITINN